MKIIFHVQFFLKFYLELVVMTQVYSLKYPPYYHLYAMEQLLPFSMSLGKYQF